MRSDHGYQITSPNLQHFHLPGQARVSSLDQKEAQYRMRQEAMTGMKTRAVEPTRRAIIRRGLLGSVLSAVLLTACPQTLPPDNSSLPAPTDVVVVPEDRAAVLFWTGVGDSQVGYNIYKDGILVNDKPINTPLSAKSALVRGGQTRGGILQKFKFKISGLENALKFKFKIKAVGSDGKEALTPT